MAPTLPVPFLAAPFNTASGTSLARCGISRGLAGADADRETGSWPPGSQWAEDTGSCYLAQCKGLRFNALYQEKNHILSFADQKPHFADPQGVDTQVLEKLTGRMKKDFRGLICN